MLIIHLFFTLIRYYDIIYKIGEFWKIIAIYKLKYVPNIVDYLNLRRKENEKSFFD